MFVVQSENNTCHWKFFANRAGLRLITLMVKVVPVYEGLHPQ
jgi:hypothetical protein